MKQLPWLKTVRKMYFLYWSHSVEQKFRSYFLIYIYSCPISEIKEIICLSFSILPHSSLCEQYDHFMGPNAILRSPILELGIGFKENKQALHINFIQKSSNSSVILLQCCRVFTIFFYLNSNLIGEEIRKACTQI